jgi:DNA-binding winged helix-turn-helix (wHTH) protein/TolB-like protein/cytochrome c-type biogenesis protein CcmH/NrfG
MTSGEANPAAPAKFRIGRWTVDPAMHQLSADGRTVRIEPKAMAVLQVLARRPGEVVSREALLSSVWPGVIVGDDALTQVIVKLRKALGDVRDEPAYVQTIAKSGYRLVAPVAPMTEAGPPPSAPADAALGAAGRRRTRLGAAAAAALLLLGAAAAWWSWTRSSTGAAPDPVATASVRLAEATLPTVAIRPFEALANDPGEALLARGITADLVTDLSKVAGLWVIALGPADGSRPDAGGGSVGRYVVSGSVQRIDDRLRVQIHLTDAQTARQVWSERFDRTTASLFEIQDEIGLAILRLLPVKVSEAETRRVAQRYTRSLEAYEAFQRGRAAMHVRRRADNAEAREMFRRAIALDPSFARAYAGLAMTYAADYRNQWTEDRTAALDRAFELARTARQIQPDLPETYWTLAFVHVHRHQHDQALRDLGEALRLYPSFADAYATLGGIYTSLGRPADGVPLLRTAMRLAPESGYLYLMLLGRAYYFLGDFEQARISLQSALVRNPEFIDAHVYLAAAHAASGDLAAAAWEAEEIRALQPAFSTRGWLATNPTANAALREKLVALLAELGL